MTGDRVRTDVRGPLGFLTLDRPNKLNAIDDAMVRGIHAGMDTLEADDRVRVIVLQGAGRAFSAGFDLEETYTAPEGVTDALAAEIQRDFDLIMRLWDADRPTIASLHGLCLGGAFELALACDLAVASEDCRLGEPEVKFGSGVVAMLLPWVCGPRRAAEVILAGEDRLDAATALDWGILNRVVPTDALQQATIDLALSIARNDRRAVRHARQALRDGYDKAGFREALAAGMQHCIDVERAPSPDAEAFQAIVQQQGTAAAVAWLDNQLNIKELTGKDHE